MLSGAYSRSRSIWLERRRMLEKQTILLLLGKILRLREYAPLRMTIASTEIFTYRAVSRVGPK